MTAEPSSTFVREPAAHGISVTQDSDSGRRCLGVIAPLAAAVLGVLIIVPWQAATVGSGIDASWIWALNEAAALGRNFGQEFVFTYGPLGYVAPRVYHPGTGVMLWLWWSAIAAAWSVLLWRHTGRAVASPLACLFLLCAAAVTPTIHADAFFLAFPVLVGSIAVFADTRSEARRDLVAASMLLGVASLIKFAFLVAALGTIVLLTAFDAWRRRWPIAATVYCATVLLVWVGLGQPLSNLQLYLSASVEMARGYGEAMSLPGNAYRATAWLLWAMVPAALALLSMAYQRRQVSLAVLGLVVLGTGFVTFKAAYVRHDAPHEIIAAGWAPVALFLAWIPLWHLNVNRRLNVILAASLLLSLVGMSASLRQWDQPAALSQLISLPARMVQNSRIIAGPANQRQDQRQRYEAARAILRDEHPLPKMFGTVDVYPTELSVVFAHGYAYAPRPIPQSYAAFTPSLAELNAAHLESIAAPENILFRVAPIDARLPSMEDGMSWPIIWARYMVVADTSGFLWLRRRAKPPKASAPILLQVRDARMGQSVLLPDVSCGGIWMQADLQPSPRYRLKSLFWKGPLVWMQYDDGSPARRLLPMVLRRGFLVTPNIRTRQEFAEFMQSGRVGSRSSTTGTSFRILVAPGARANFLEQYSLRFFHVLPGAACAPYDTAA